MTLAMNQGSVVCIAGCRLSLGDAAWAFAQERQAEIEAHWLRRSSENPQFFNGGIHLLRSYQIAGGMLEATLLRTDFKSFLYWRETGETEAGVRDAFGSALIRSSEGHVILGRQRSGNINSGLAYLPGGFIDARDVTAAGTIDIDVSIAREVLEETGLVPDAMTRRPGFFVTSVGAQISIAAEFVSPLTAVDLGRRIASHIARDADAELQDIVVMRHKGDCEGVAMPAFTRLLLEAILP